MKHTKSSIFRGQPPKSLMGLTGFVMYKISQHVVERSDEAFASEGLKGRHFCVLQILINEGPQTQQELCESMWVDRASMVGVIDDLEARKYVERTQKPGDRRSHHIAVTAPGRAFHKKKAQLIEKIEQDVFKHLRPTELARFRSTLQDLMVHLCEHPELEASL